MPSERRTCLRCGRRPAVGRWQCANCREQFHDWDERDYSAVLEGLSEDERSLAAVADRIDGAGFWAAARAVSHAQKKVSELAAAIENELRR